jgi:hypothetical protein
MKLICRRLAFCIAVVGVLGGLYIANNVRLQERPRAKGQSYFDENGQAQVEGEPPQREKVSLSGLIANRAKYDGRPVETQGCLVYAFEHMALYVSREDAFNGLSYNGAWIDGFNDREWNEENKQLLLKSHLQYVTVTGTFHRVGHAHLGHHYGGALSNLLICGIERKVSDIPPLWAATGSSAQRATGKPEKSP